MALARDIEAAGWSVWWDPEIRAGENHRDVILRELDAAKAVLVIWTQHSVKSEWVISEASRAMRKPRDRYVAVREEDLDEHDIPPPFDQRHAAKSGDRDSIQRAIRGMNKSSTANASEVAAILPASTESDARQLIAEQTDDDYWETGWHRNSPPSFAPSGSSPYYGGAFGPADALRSRMYLAKFPRGRHALEAYRELTQVIEYCEKYHVLPEAFGDPPFESVATLHALHNNLASKRGAELLPDPKEVNLDELVGRIEATNEMLKKLIARGSS